MAAGSNTKVITSLPAAANVVTTDQLVVVYNAVGNASLGSTSTRLINVDSFAVSLAPTLKISNNPPNSSSANGLPGSIAYANGYFYVCVANNTWQRTTLSSW